VTAGHLLAGFPEALWLPAETARLLGLSYPAAGGEPSENKGGLAGRWHNREIGTVTPDDIHDVIEEATERGVPGLKRRKEEAHSATRGRAMAAALSKLFSWAKDKRKVQSNPAADAYKPDAPQTRERVLNVKLDKRRADELRWFWSAAGNLGELFGRTAQPPCHHPSLRQPPKA
jgi:hypothetical protein